MWVWDSQAVPAAGCAYSALACPFLSISFSDSCAYLKGDSYIIGSILHWFILGREEGATPLINLHFLMNTAV